MKILHLYSNWKWTGPAEHALNLSLMQQKKGHNITFACASPPASANESIVKSALQAGIVPLTGFTLNKHFHIISNIADIVKLRKFIQQERFDLIHTHLQNDHFLAVAASHLFLPPIPIVRTCYEGDGPKGSLKTRLLLSKLTDGIITISERARAHIIQHYDFPSERIWKVHTPVDHCKFNPEKVKSNRAQFGLSEGDIVGGIVARVQRHRRFEVILDALSLVLQEFPRLKFMIIGRGTHIEEIAMKPAQDMGLRTNIIFTGYRGKDFPETLACLDFKIFLVPGTDGSCRAVREAMAMGIPVIAANRGMLPEIITDGIEGFVIDDTPKNLAKAVMSLIENPDLRVTMGRHAMEKSKREFNADVQAEKVEKIYKQLLSQRL